MKILYVTSKGGIHDYRFLKKLADDYEVLLLHYAADELSPQIQDIRGLKIISKKPFKKSFPLLSEYWHFKKIVKEFAPDIIHTGYVWQVGILAAMMNFHPHLSMVWGSDILVEPGTSAIIKRLVAKVMRQADHIQCDAEFVKQKILTDYRVDSGKVTVFPWGIDLDLFHPLDKADCRKLLHFDTDKFVVLFNRHLDPVYGVRYMLEGFRKFAEDKNDVLLAIVSDGTKKEQTTGFISENNLSDKIKIVGRVANAQLVFYLNASDVYISTSLSDGTSLSLLEAMACQMGLVVSDVPAIKEWVDDSNGIVVPRKDSDSVAEALNKYYSNRTLIEEHGKQNALIAHDRADWNRNYEKLKEIYRKIT